MLNRELKALTNTRILPSVKHSDIWTEKHVFHLMTTLCKCAPTTTLLLFSLLTSRDLH